MSPFTREVHAGPGLTAPAEGVTSDLWRVLAHQAGHRPTKLALKFEGQTWTYAALATAAQRALQLLQARGVRAGDRVAYLGLNHAAQLVVLFALARLGAVLVPLNFRLAPAE